MTDTDAHARTDNGAVAGLVAALDGIETQTRESLVRHKSRDFFWYSPVLKRQLDALCGDLLIVPKTRAELVRAVAACHAAGVPLTARAGGTGNYGQAMPLRGGAILDLSAINRVVAIEPGRVVAEPGVRMLDLDRQTQTHSGQELRFHPSTRKLGTIGGFVAGGSSGVGSITWGLLGDAGNVLGATVVTMEAEPRVLRLGAKDVHKVAHAYGTNGIIVEVEMPLAPAYDWREIVVEFDDFIDSVRYADALGDASGILKKLVTPVAAPVPQHYFKPLRPFIDDGRHAVLLMIAPHSVDAFDALTAAHGGREVYRRGAGARADADIPPLYEFAWNHTTLQALKVDRSVTYLQSLFAPGRHIDRVEHMYRHFGDEVPMHLEFVRFRGQTACFGLQLVRFTTEQRLDEIIRYHEDNGVPIFNPHKYTLEEGGMKVVDRDQLAFKREADPQGLLNPGKMLGWDHPDYDGRPHTALFR